MNASPITMQTTPAITSTAVWWATRWAPSSPKLAPNAMKTTENPATNRIEPSSTRLRGAAFLSRATAAWATAVPGPSLTRDSRSDVAARSAADRPVT